jgi:hypothetical protein
MARGWESKSVEDQIGAAEAQRELRATHQRSAEEGEQKHSLMLSRSLILTRLEAASNPHYRAQLRTALDQLEAQLRELG